MCLPDLVIGPPVGVIDGIRDAIENTPLEGRTGGCADFCCPPTWSPAVPQRGVVCPPTWSMRCPPSAPPSVVLLGAFGEEDFAVLTTIFLANARASHSRSWRQRSHRRSAETLRALLHDCESNRCEAPTRPTPSEWCRSVASLNRVFRDSCIPLGIGTANQVMNIPPWAVSWAVPTPARRHRWHPSRFRRPCPASAGARGRARALPRCRRSWLRGP